LLKREKTAEEISQDKVKTREATRQKAFDLGLDSKCSKEQQQRVYGKKTCFCSSQLVIPI
jgi:hypothetical protein